MERKLEDQYDKDNENIVELKNSFIPWRQRGIAHPKNKRNMNSSGQR